MTQLLLLDLHSTRFMGQSLIVAAAWVLSAVLTHADSSSLSEVLSLK